MAALKRLRSFGFGLLTAALAGGATNAPGVQPLARLSRDAAVAEVLGKMRDIAPYGLLRIDKVRIVDPVTERVTPDSTIYVRDTRIVWTGKTVDAPKVADAIRIDGHGRFAVPGLTDMHIHSSRADGWLLNLAAGVTTVRDMDGFPWILRARDQINAGKMLGPTDYVAGTIIAAEPLDGYAVVVANPADARRAVRQQAACGYDFIKVHNALRQAQFDAVAEQAHALGMDLVGHVPHDISLDHALHVGRMRTTEHLKGFLIDQTLLPSDEDYKTALAGTETWITPTLYTRRVYGGGWAPAFMVSRLPAYAPPEVRLSWRQQLAHPDQEQLALGVRFRNTQEIVMQRLKPLKPHWLTGTDAEGYPFNVMGFALLDELGLMQSEGLSAADVFRASTVEAAAAMHESGEFGVIAKGYRADLLLLDANPLQDLSALNNNQGVMVHGHWLDRQMLDKALTDLATIYSDAWPVPPMSAANERELINRLVSAQAGGFVFDDGALVKVADALSKAGQTSLAASVRSLMSVSSGSPCFVRPPTD